MLLQHVQAQAETAGDIDWDINVDFSPIRAHHHAAGAPEAAPSTPPGPSGKRTPRRSVRGADAGESRASVIKAAVSARATPRPWGSSIYRDLLQIGVWPMGRAWRSLYPNPTSRRSR
jgi:hypothetical protein